ncbi:hypothetical protein ABET11_21870 [Priestia megaterium]|uniref:hypothetical protein n=1 Tax=Priestia TaxID=2800373 RepID=UPI000BF9506C|nr:MULTISPECIES: hypothetical protein [Priestia]MDP1442430.1 hypothetical protein [Priestia megaterium]MDP1471448.1 hypothetical protein [Priestia megaterium]PEW08773.1 hypothetical protein CN435_28740 [Priestia megaterium]PEZ50923.1 hypothetical protein CN367_01895 [Priestia megaterium]PFL64450.1 hypothetical protein COJ36_20695 [Priestia megaterium]
MADIVLMSLLHPHKNLIINKEVTFKAQELEIIGVSFKSFAHALEAIGGIEILQEEKQTGKMDFIF